ncbi:MAG: hypothetical protein RL698_1779 [Pseudomonadota bacterium]|jgi:hypothetical protein
MRGFLYGILMGAIVAWLYATEAQSFGGLVDGLFHLRDTARLSVCGYGGNR